MITLDDVREYGAKMRIVGVGGGGCNAVNGMITQNLAGVDFIAINTDLQVLEANKASHKIQIGKNLTKGLGAGANPEIGKRAAEEDLDDIKRHLDGSDLVFITGGMGGGTGTGAAPVIAETAKSLGALTIGIVTKPFGFEREKRMAQAVKGIEELRRHVDTLIVIPNEKLLTVLPKNTTLMQAFKTADDILYRATKGISDLITNTGYINVDFADIKKVMSNAGDAIMGMGIGTGANRGEEAVRQAISSPLLEETNIEGASGILLNFTCPMDVTMEEVELISGLITKVAGRDADVIWGYVVDENLQNEIHVTVIAAGLNRRSNQKATDNETAPTGMAFMKKNSSGGYEYFDHLHAIRMNQYRDLETPAIKRTESDIAAESENALIDTPVLQQTGTDGNLTDSNIPTFLRNHLKR